MDTAIKKEHEKIMSLAQDKDMLHAYRMYEQFVYDFNTGMYNATKKGREEGIAIGEKEGRKKGREEGIAIGEKKVKEVITQSAIRLKRSGFSTEQVAPQFLGLSIEEVTQILEGQV
jgi:predicted transposase YdaD